MCATTPKGRELRRERDSLVLDVDTQPAMRMAWIAVGELGGESAGALEEGIRPEKLPTGGRVDDVKSIVVTLYGKPEDVEAVLPKLDLRKLRKII